MFCQGFVGKKLTGGSVYIMINSKLSCNPLCDIDKENPAWERKAVCTMQIIHTSSSKVLWFVEWVIKLDIMVEYNAACSHIK